MTTTQASQILRRDGPAAQELPSTLPALLLARLEAQGDTPALRHKRRGRWVMWTWSDVWREVRRTAHAMAALGVERGSAVVIQGHGAPELVFAALGALARGARIVPLGENDDPLVVRDAIAASDATVAFAATTEAAFLLARFGDASSLRAVVSIRDPLVVAGPLSVPWTGYREFAASGVAPSAEADALWIEIAKALPVDTVAFEYPRRNDAPLPLDHGRLVTAARLAAERDGIRADDSVLVDAPLWRIPEVTLLFSQWLVAGFALVLPESPDTLARDRREISPTALIAPLGVHRRLEALHADRAGTASSWRARLIRGALGVSWDVAVARREGRAPGLLNGVRALLLRALVLRPLAHALGLGRARIAVATDGELDAETQRFLTALGIEVTALSRAQRLEDVRVSAAPVVSADAPPQREGRPRPIEPIDELIPGAPFGAML